MQMKQDAECRKKLFARSQANTPFSGTCAAASSFDEELQVISVSQHLPDRHIKNSSTVICVSQHLRDVLIEYGTVERIRGLARVELAPDKEGTRRAEELTDQREHEVVAGSAKGEERKM